MLVLNDGVGQVIAVLSLITMIGVIFLIFNDCVDESSVSVNYEKFRIKCLVGAFIVLMTTFIFYSFYTKINDDLEDYVKS